MRKNIKIHLAMKLHLPNQLFIIIRSKNHKQTLYCRHLVAYCSVKMAPQQLFYFSPLSTTAMDCCTCEWVSLTTQIFACLLFLLSIGNYNLLSCRCALKDIKTDILGFVKTGRMVQMYKCKKQTNNGTITPW